MATLETPESVLVGRRGLEGITGINSVGMPSWSEAELVWGMEFSVSISTPSAEIPRSTRWFVVVEQTYPRGNVKVFPAKVGGIDVTMPHQSRNDFGTSELPWRGGKLCLERPLAVLGMDTEEYSASRRLAWHVGRTIEWVTAAATGTLRGPGERFELPELPAGRFAESIGFMEDASTFASWTASSHQSGSAEFERCEGWWRVSHLGGVNLQPAWGSWPTSPSRRKGVWLRLPGVPVVRNWQFPETWGELRQAVASLGGDLDKHLMSLIPEVRREREPLLLLIGAPMPQTWDGPLLEYHWWAIALSDLASPKRAPRGYRGKEGSLWRYDRQHAFADARPIQWVKSTNLAPHRIGARSHASAEIIESQILLLGVGALGSAVAELLVRQGARRLVLVDDDTLEAGNLPRHTLTLRDVRRPKVASVAARLASVSPLAVIQGAKREATARGSLDDLPSPDVVIECTADREALEALESFGTSRPIHWFSVSVSVSASRLYIFYSRSEAFPRMAFDAAIGPWVDRDWSEVDESTLSSEGPGCWHPLSPARGDDVAALAAIAVRVVDECVRGTGEDTRLIVFERVEQNGEFGGFVRVRA